MMHADSQIQMVWIVMRLLRRSMIMAIVVIVILLRRLTLWILFIFHATILEPNFNLNSREIW